MLLVTKHNPLILHDIFPSLQNKCTLGSIKCLTKDKIPLSLSPILFCRKKGKYVLYSDFTGGLKLLINKNISDYNLGYSRNLATNFQVFFRLEQGQNPTCFLLWCKGPMIIPPDIFC